MPQRRTAAHPKANTHLQQHSSARNHHPNTAILQPNCPAALREPLRTGSTQSCLCPLCPPVGTDGAVPAASLQCPGRASAHPAPQHSHESIPNLRGTNNTSGCQHHLQSANQHLDQVTLLPGATPSSSSSSWCHRPGLHGNTPGSAQGITADTSQTLLLQHRGICAKGNRFKVSLI